MSKAGDRVIVELVDPDLDVDAVLGGETRSRAQFSTAQGHWSVISDQPGLVGQVGGWDNSGRALVLGLWADDSAYRSFMRLRHDAVADQAGQRRTYTEIELAIGEVMFLMSGEAESVPSAIAGGSLLCVAYCQVRPGRDAHFIDLGHHRYLVTTLWSDPAAHQRYASQDVPRLRARAALDDDLRTMAGHSLVLETAWRVLPDA